MGGFSVKLVSLKFRMLSCNLSSPTPGLQKNLPFYHKLTRSWNYYSELKLAEGLGINQIFFLNKPSAAVVHLLCSTADNSSDSNFKFYLRHLSAGKSTVIQGAGLGSQMKQQTFFSNLFRIALCSTQFI